MFYKPFLLAEFMKKIYGVGINDADYAVSEYGTVDGVRKRVWICPRYLTWRNMLTRCYSPRCQEKHPTYIGCTVVPKWHSFMAFRAWMLTQDHEGKELDKDILFPGNKVYSPDFCVFVPAKINAFLTDHAAARGQWPIGVSWEADCKKFKSSCSNPFTGKLENLGRFMSPGHAHEAWRRRKHQHSCAYADQQTDDRVAAALRSRYDSNEYKEHSHVA